MIHFSSVHHRPARPTFAGTLDPGAPSSSGSPLERGEADQFVSNQQSVPLAAWLADIPVIQPIKDHYLLTDAQAGLVGKVLDALPRAAHLRSQLGSSPAPFEHGESQIELAGLRFALTQFAKYSPTFVVRLQALAQGQPFTDKDRQHLMSCYANTLEKYPQPVIFLMEEVRSGKPLSSEEEAFLSGFLAFYYLADKGYKNSGQPPDLTAKLANRFKEDLHFSDQQWADGGGNVMTAILGNNDAQYLEAKKQEKLRQEAEQFKKSKDALLSGVAFTDPDLGDITGLRMLNLIDTMKHRQGLRQCMTTREILELFPDVKKSQVKNLLVSLWEKDYLEVSGGNDLYKASFFVQKMNDSFYADYYSNDIARLRFRVGKQGKQALKDARNS